MPKFYFHIRDGNNLLEDPEAQDFPTLHAAREEALKAARDIISEEIFSGKALGLKRSFDIADAKGKIVATVPFDHAVPSNNGSTRD